MLFIQGSIILSNQSRLNRWNLYTAPFQGTNYESKASICSNLAFNAFEDISVLFGPNGWKWTEYRILPVTLKCDINILRNF